MLSIEDARSDEAVNAQDTRHAQGNRKRQDNRKRHEEAVASALSTHFKRHEGTTDGQ